MYITSAVIFTGLLALGNAAAVDTHPVLVAEREAVGNGTLTWFTAPPGKRDADRDLLVSRDTGCGTNNIKCSSGHPYHGPTCNTLISLLGSTYVLNGYQAVCLDLGVGQCCISWSKATRFPIMQKDLVPSAQRSLNTCGLARMSGQEWNVRLGDTCLSQCLSDRPTGCT